MSDAPFTAEQFFAVFTSYNHAVWPFQLVLGALAVLVVLAVLLRPAVGSRAALGFLSVLWVWAGVAYHLIQFTRVNPAAWVFGPLFVLQGALFAVAALRGAPALRFRSTWRGWIGAAGIAYSLVVYPLLGMASGHPYPGMPTFGVPCPSTIFTFGVLLWADGPIPVRLAILPALWALLAAPAALGWGVLEDAAMPLIALVTLGLLARERWSARRGMRLVGAPALDGARRGIGAGLLALALAMLAPTGASAQSEPAPPWQLRASVVISGTSHRSVPAGYKVYSGVALDAGVSRALERGMSLELSLRTESREVNGPSVNGVATRLGSLEMIPVSLVAGWRPLVGRAASVQPILGAGVVFTDVWEKSGALDSTESTPQWGPALLAGASIHLSGRTALDLRATWNPLELEIQDFAPRAPKVSIDPLTLGLGIAVGL